MEKKRFSSDELYDLRNHIPVAALIEKGLEMTCQTRNGRFCFQCPLCGSFNTGIKHKSNLAKCFSCEKIFNTIDLVMKTRQSEFVDSIRFLKKFYASLSGSTNRLSTADPSKNAVPSQSTSRKPASSHGPEHIGQVLDAILIEPGSTKTSRADARSENPDYRSSEQRILKLEQQVACLSRQIEKIVKIVDPDPPSQ